MKGPGQLARCAGATAVEVLVETISENGPASSRCKNGLRDDIRKDWQSLVVMEFTAGILTPTDRSWHQSHTRLSPFNLVACRTTVVCQSFSSQEASSMCYVMYSMAKPILVLLLQVRSAL